MNPASATATETFGPYEVYERLGMGGMASVHRAKKRGPAGFERTVALKRMLSHLTEDRGFIESFVREAKLASLLVHPNVAQIYDFGRIGGVFYIAMELVAGFDIRKVLRYAHRTGKAIPLGVILTVLAELCDALDYAHSFVDENGVALDIVHRDISPSNIIIAHTGHVKVIDFGIAKASSTPLHTESGLVKGKLGYMAPEAAMGLQVNAASDMFSVGVTAWELVTALPLFSARTDYETMRKLREETVPPPSRHNPACPPRLERLIDHALQRDPEHRIASARVFRAEIEAIAQEVGVQLSARAVADWTKLLADNDTTARAPTVLPLPPEPETALSKPRPASLSKAPRLRRSSDEIQLATEIWGDPTVYGGAVHQGADFSAAEPELYQPDGIILPVAPPPPATTTAVRKSALPLVMLGGLAVIAGVLAAVLYAKRAAPPKASVVFHTEPQDAIVEIAGKQVGSSAALAPGVYSVTVRSDGYKPWTTSMTLAAGDHQTINVALEHEAVAIVEPPKPPKHEAPPVRHEVVTPPVRHEVVTPPARHEAVTPPVRESKRAKAHREEVAKVEPPKHEEVEPPKHEEPEPPKQEVAKIEPPKIAPAVVEKPKTTPVVAATAVTKLSGDIPALQGGGGGASGDVLAKMCIDETGRVSSVQIKKSPGDIASELQHALTAWRYKPYLKGDKASPVCFALQLRVVLKP